MMDGSQRPAYEITRCEGTPRERDETKRDGYDGGATELEMGALPQTTLNCTFRNLGYSESLCLAENMAVDTVVFERFIHPPPANLHDTEQYFPKSGNFHGLFTSTDTCDNLKFDDKERYGGGGLTYLTGGFRGLSSSGGATSSGDDAATASGASGASGVSGEGGTHVDGRRGTTKTTTTATMFADNVIARESKHTVYAIGGSYGARNPWHELE